MENLSDKELIELIRSGDEQALDFLLKKYKKLATKLTRSYFLIGEEFEDLLQEAMIGLVNACKKYDLQSTASFSTFASLCITRQIQSAVKHANSKKNEPLKDYISLQPTDEPDEEDDVVIVIPSSLLSPEEQLIQKETVGQIKKEIVSTLSDFELKVLELFLKGEKYTEIAIELGKTNKQIDNALSRIRNKLSFLKK